MEYDTDCGKFTIPRTEFLLHQTKRIEAKLIKWFKENKYSNGDDYSVRITKKGKWAVSYSNDYPMQHGSGQEYVLTESDFIEAIKSKYENKNLQTQTKSLVRTGLES
jgi:hypothetical protein